MNAEADDELAQSAFFKEDFYPLSQWRQERKICEAELSPEQVNAYKQEHLRQFIRCVKQLHNTDHDFEHLRRESLGQNITVVNPQPRVLS